tara:strand:- start:428 stop:604 length:177 start_codon:yes stop_codon:yes gene_type:complete
MRPFKSISVRPETFLKIKRLTETLLPKVKLSNSQVIESALRHCSEGKEDNEIRIQEKD